MNTQAEKIVAYMIRRQGEVEWFHAYDFMPPHLAMSDPCFVGYEATARISELAGDYPAIIETGKDGKYRTIRFKFEVIDDALEALDGIAPNLRTVIVKELEDKGLVSGIIDKF
jgi:hypothetical protein